MKFNKFIGCLKWFKDFLKINGYFKALLYQQKIQIKKSVKFCKKNHIQLYFRGLLINKNKVNQLSSSRE